jgi:hypothetical protein
MCFQCILELGTGSDVGIIITIIFGDLAFNVLSSLTWVRNTGPAISRRTTSDRWLRGWGRRPSLSRNRRVILWNRRRRST